MKRVLLKDIEGIRDIINIPKDSVETYQISIIDHPSHDDLISTDIPTMFAVAAKLHHNRGSESLMSGGNFFMCIRTE